MSYNFSGTTHAFTGTVEINGKTVTPVDDIGITIDGGGSVITAGSKGFKYVSFAGTITGATILGDQSGDVVIDVKKSSYAGFPTTASICAAAKPTLAAAQKSQDLTLTGWTVAFAAGDCFEFIVDSAATVTRVALSLTVERG